MMKKVIYTCITGEYDDLLQPLVIDTSFDYVCFTDHKTMDKNGIWRIELLPDIQVNTIKASRYPKMNPHKLLEEYDYSVYIDANILIQQMSFYKSIDKCIENRLVLAGIKHPQMNCLYDEYFNVYKQRKETNLKQLYKEYCVIRKSGFPRNYGMYEANIILRNHNDPRVIQQCNDWWKMFLTYTKRDQLCYSYTLWKNNFTLQFLMDNCSLHSGNQEPYKILYHPTRTSSKIDFWNRLLFKMFPELMLRKIFYFVFNL